MKKEEWTQQALENLLTRFSQCTEAQKQAISKKTKLYLEKAWDAAGETAVEIEDSYDINKEVENKASGEVVYFDECTRILAKRKSNKTAIVLIVMVNMLSFFSQFTSPSNHEARLRIDQGVKGKSVFEVGSSKYSPLIVEYRDPNDETIYKYSPISGSFYEQHLDDLLPPNSTGYQM